MNIGRYDREKTFAVTAVSLRIYADSFPVVVIVMLVAFSLHAITFVSVVEEVARMISVRTALPFRFRPGNSRSKKNRGNAFGVLSSIGFPESFVSLLLVPVAFIRLLALFFGMISVRLRERIFHRTSEHGLFTQEFLESQVNTSRLSVGRLLSSDDEPGRSSSVAYWLAAAVIVRKRKDARASHQSSNKQKNTNHDVKKTMMSPSISLALATASLPWAASGKSLLLVLLPGTGLWAALWQLCAAD